jgi:hypothetical protein
MIAAFFLDRAAPQSAVRRAEVLARILPIAAGRLNIDRRWCSLFGLYIRSFAYLPDARGAMRC